VTNDAYSGDRTNKDTHTVEGKKIEPKGSYNTNYKELSHTHKQLSHAQNNFKNHFNYLTHTDYRELKLMKF
jgi:hypothetical protein